MQVFVQKKIDVISQKLYHYVDNAAGITKKKRPLEHHYIAIRSLIRRNKIFWLAGLPELIPLRIEKYKIVPSYGWGAYLKLMYYYYSHDCKLIPCLIKKIGAKFF